MCISFLPPFSCIMFDLRFSMLPVLQELVSDFRILNQLKFIFI